MTAMSYIIDGHNLIPKVPGLSLEDEDDEMKLIALLQEYSRRRRTKVTVFFDNAPPSYQGMQRFGTVTAYFVRSGVAADLAIVNHIKKLGKRARNLIVVSSDRAVQNEARYHQARTLSSEDFARGLVSSKENTPEPGTEIDPNPTTDEIDYWLSEFKAYKPTKTNRKKPGPPV
jgi:uncharacterized protein